MGYIKLRDQINKLFEADLDKVCSDGYTRLQNAIRRGDVNRVRSLITAGVNLNEHGKLGLSPLHMALEYEELSIAEHLIHGDAEVNKRDKLGLSPLHKAVESNSISLIFLLLQKGADPNIKNVAGRTAAHYLHNTHREMLKLFIKCGLDINTEDNNLNSLLHSAIPHKKDTAMMLLKMGLDPNKKNNLNETPFSKLLNNYKGIGEEEEALILKMISAGAYPKTMNDKGETVLHIAAKHDNSPLLRALAQKGASCNIKDREGNTALHYLIKTQHVFILSQFMRDNSDIINDKNKAGLTPLAILIEDMTGYFSFDSKKSGVIDTLLSSGADVNTPNKRGQTLLHIASSTHSLGLLSLLLDYGADPNIIDNNQRSPLYYAIQQKDINTIDILLDHGADPNHPNDRGWTLLDQLAKEGDRESPIVQRLITGGGEYNKQLPHNNNALEKKPANNNLQPITKKEKHRFNKKPGS